MLCDFYDESLTYQENLLAKFYVKHGHEVVVVTSAFDSVFDYVNDRYDRRASARTYRAGGATIIKLPYRLNLLNRVRMFQPLDDIFEREAPDLIFVHDIMLNMVDAVRYLQRSPGTRMIMDYHADYSNSGKNWVSLKILHGVIRKWALERARPHLQRIFPIVPASATFLHEVYRVPYDDMELLPLGADLDLSREVRAAGAGTARRATYSFAASDFVVFTGGKLAPAKRTELLIEAMRRLDRPDVRLVVAGDAAPQDAAYRQSLEAAAAGDPRIVFTGWLDTRAVHEHLDMCDIAAFPASQSILWQQAIGMGRPLVIGEPMARTGGRQDVTYLNRYDNIIIMPGVAPAVDELADALARLADDQALRRRMGAGAERVADELLDWNKAVERTLRFNVAAAPTAVEVEVP
jgi:glycosyltransferase involved in cell wall biosynthesis